MFAVVKRPAELPYPVRSGLPYSQPLHARHRERTPAAAPACEPQECLPPARQQEEQRRREGAAPAAASRSAIANASPAAIGRERRPASSVSASRYQNAAGASLIGWTAMLVSTGFHATTMAVAAAAGGVRDRRARRYVSATVPAPAASGT